MKRAGNTRHLHSKQAMLFFLIAILGSILSAHSNHFLQAQEMPPEPVRLIHCDSSRVKIDLPDYWLKYDRTSTEGFLLIISKADSTGALATAFLPEASFHLLQPQFLKSIEAKNTADSLVVTFTSQKSWATFTTRLIVYKATPNLIHWTTTVFMLEWHPISNFDRDVQFYKLDTALSLEPSMTAYADQDGYAAGITTLYEKNFVNSTVFYFQDFSVSNAYFQWIHASPKNTVGHSAGDFGYLLPTSTANLKKGNQYTLSSAFLVLRPGMPSSENELARDFLEALAGIYPHIEKPPLIPHDWKNLAEHTLQDLNTPKCLVSLNGQEFLRSYVDIPRLGSAEMITQLDVLRGMYTLEKSTGISSPLKSQIEGNLLSFYNTEHEQIVNDYPNEGISRGDSWYTVELAIGLSQLAQMGSSVASMLLFQSVPAIIQFARTVSYDFPVFFSYGTYQKISGSEPDVAGGYAYLMLNCYNLKPDSLYLQEAEKAIAHVIGKGFQLSYELQMTGATAAACARLYQLTGKSRYLELSRLPLANIFLHTWLWECNYGAAAHYSTFFGLNPMPGANVITMKEQYETWQYLREYVSILRSELQPDVANLLQGFIRYTPQVLFYTLPPNLPSEALWTKTAAYGSTNDNSLTIPYEDLRDGWQKSGQIGQEIYGAGGVLCLAAALKSRVKEEKTGSIPGSFILLRNYPNPFSSTTTLFVKNLALSKWASKKFQLTIYNTLGQAVRRLSAAKSLQQNSCLRWDGRNDRGEKLPAGIYFAVLKSNQRLVTQKMVLLP